MERSCGIYKEYYSGYELWLGKMQTEEAKLHLQVPYHHHIPLLLIAVTNINIRAENWKLGPVNMKKWQTIRVDVRSETAVSS